MEKYLFGHYVQTESEKNKKGEDVYMRKLSRSPPVIMGLELCKNIIEKFF